MGQGNFPNWNWLNMELQVHNVFGDVITCMIISFFFLLSFSAFLLFLSFQFVNETLQLVIKINGLKKPRHCKFIWKSLKKKSYIHSALNDFVENKIDWKMLFRNRKKKINFFFSTFFQIIGAVCVGLIANYSYYSYRIYHNYTYDLFFFLIATTFMIATFIILVSCIISISTASILPKTIFVSNNIKKRRVFKLEFHDDWILSDRLNCMYRSLFRSQSQIFFPELSSDSIFNLLDILWIVYVISTGYPVFGYQ